MSSLTNAALSLYVIRTVDAAEFGAFSLAYVTYGFALNVSRGLATDPLMVRFSGTDLPTWRRAVRDCTGTAAAVGLALGAIMIAASLFLPGTTRPAFLALGLTLPGLMLQDSWRYSFFALGRGGQALLNDVVWALTLVPALLLLRVLHHTTVFFLVLAWGVTATIAASVGPVQAQVVPKLTGAWAWVYQHRDLGFRYVAEGIATPASAQVRAYGISLILGLAAVGYMGAANTMMGPVTILSMGMALVTLPEAARVLRTSPRHLWPFCLLVGCGLGVAALAWGIILLVALPHGFGAVAFGSIWKPTYSLVALQTVAVVFWSFSTGAGTGLHALGAAKRSLRSILFTAAITAVLVLAGALTGGVLWAVRGQALAAFLTAVVSWWQFRVALRESRARGPAADGAMVGKHRTNPAIVSTGETAAPRVDIGKTLTLARRQAGLTIGQLSQHTGIDSDIVSEIERNDYSSCGGDFYARVFIRSIARVIGADSVPLIAEFDGQQDSDQEDDSLLGTNTLALILPNELAAAGRPRSAIHTRGWAKMLLVPIIVLAAVTAVSLIAFQLWHAASPAPAGHAHHHVLRARPPVTKPGTAVLRPASITAFGPGPTHKGDNPQFASLAIDNSPATAWVSHWYATAKFGNLKPGTGLLLDLGARMTVTSVEITLGAQAGTDLEIRVGDTPKYGLLHPAARRIDGTGTVRLNLTQPTTGRYVLIWVYRLPPDGTGTFTASIYDISVSGKKPGAGSRPAGA